jgi:steroid delta-isomerase-like uncharacterized protein
MTADHRRLIDQFVLMINKRDATLLDEFTAPDHIDHNPAVDNGIEANRAFWGQLFTAFPDLTVTVQDVVVSDDRVVGRFAYTATHLGPFLGIPASRRTIRLTSIDIWRIENGLFAEHWDEVHIGDVIRQITGEPDVLEAAS